MSHHIQRSFRNLGLALGAVALTALAVEVLLRGVGYAPTQFGNLAHVSNGRHTHTLDCYPDNPRGYFALDLRDPATCEHYRQAGFHRIDEVAPRAPWAVEIRYNSHHFRGAEIGPKVPGTLRVAILGDSFTEAQGVKEEDSLPRALEERLRSTEGLAAEVANCGRRATDFPALEAQFDQVLTLDPDVVVYAMVLNDGERSAEFNARQRYVNDWIIDMGRQAQGGLAPRLTPWDGRLVALVRDRVSAWRLGEETTAWYRDMYGPPNAVGWLRTQDHIRAMRRRQMERGGQFILALWPLLVGLEGRYPFGAQHREIARFCLDAGIRFVDLLPVLRGRPSSTLWVHPVDRHPNEVANRLAVAALAPEVLRAIRPGR